MSFTVVRYDRNASKIALTTMRYENDVIRRIECPEWCNICFKLSSAISLILTETLTKYVIVEFDEIYLNARCCCRSLHLIDCFLCDYFQLRFHLYLSDCV